MIVLYAVLVTLLSPLVALAVVVHPRLRAHLRERLGLVRLEVEPGAVWIHAASLGEGRAAEALIAAIRPRVGGAPILRTCTSRSARDQRVGADQTCCLPVDVPFVVAAWLDRVRPRCLLLVEAELWPNLLAACRRRGIPIAVVGARIGPGLRRLRAIPGVWGPLTRGVQWLPADAAAAAVVGGTPLGELKRDAPRRPATFAWSRDAIVAGCTWAGEETVLLDAMARLAPPPLLILAPRDPERFDEVARLLDARGARWIRRTALGTAGRGGVVPADVDVVLLDTLGELAGLYEHARAAFLGGTFDARVGGHSPAEAQAAGCPLVHGPFTEGHAAAWEAVESFPALSPDDLPMAFVEAFAATPVLPAAGATARAAVALTPFFAAPIPVERPLRPWLYPLVPFWMLGVKLRARNPRKAPVPVISVGALTAGGTGKTPVAGWIARHLAAYDPVVVSRGFGRRAGADVRLVGEVTDLGDELVMLARRGIRVASAPDRLAGVSAAVARGARLAILDDALQYGEIARDLEIVVLDARWPLGGGPIPVGTARLPRSWLARADIVWVNHGPLPPALAAYLRPDAIVVRAEYRPVGWLYHGQRLPLDALPSRLGAAFAGVARPEGFFQQVRNLGVQLDRTWIFPDHHPYGWHDLQSIEAWLDDHVVLTTEKDAARLPPTSGVHALLVDIEIVEGREALEARLAAVAARVAGVTRPATA
ncbi:MAG: tetraacyldisaccharide 4'-kinase [Pseudomonadota bacterium]|nr:tetraacyldisaccharide 4'-kinase [Pseudomonadota bacterium]